MVAENGLPNMLCQKRSVRNRLTELPWGHSGIFFEYLREVALVIEADCNRDVDDGVVCIREQAFAFLNAHHVQVFLEGEPGGLLEQSGEV